MSKPRITPIVMPGTSTIAAEENSLSKDQRKNAHDAARAIAGAFAWDRTAEGYDFWESVHIRLHAISEGEPLK